MDKFESAAEMFVGKHDFRSFMQYSKEQKTVREKILRSFYINFDKFFYTYKKDACYAQRKMLSVTVEQSIASVLSTNRMMCDEYFKFYDITFMANSYVYRQVIQINSRNIKKRLH